MSKDELKTIAEPPIRAIYNWLHSAKEVLTVIVFIYAGFTWIRGEVKTAAGSINNRLDRMDSTYAYMAIDKKEHEDFGGRITKLEICSIANRDSIIDLEGTVTAHQSKLMEISNELLQISRGN